VPLSWDEPGSDMLLAYERAANQRRSQRAQRADVRTFLIAAAETDGRWAMKRTFSITTVETDGRWAVKRTFSITTVETDGRWAVKRTFPITTVETDGRWAVKRTFPITTVETFSGRTTDRIGRYALPVRFRMFLSRPNAGKSTLTMP
jgi:hypothetical protein